jgi:N-acetyl-gamma-glutamyl-phosphate reductase common form
MGGEALRVLLGHPEVEVAWVTSRRPGPVSGVHPNLYGRDLEFVDLESVPVPDFVFLALPTAASIGVAERFVTAGARVIDLGSAFRLRDRALWERVYGQAHTAWPLAEEAVYGISELHGEAIARARIVANPGCFSSAAILGLAPLVGSGLIDTERLVVDGLSGTAGAGAEFSRAIHHPEIGENVVFYNVVGHRHTYEVEQELAALSGRPARVHFTPCYVPIVRGIAVVCRAFLTAPVRRSDLLGLFGSFYGAHPFVEVYDQPLETGVSWQYLPYPWVRSVAGANYCFIGLDVDEERGSVVVISVLDSIGKGGAHAGVENLNLMAGFDRTAGLTTPGLHP